MSLRDLFVLRPSLRAGDRAPDFALADGSGQSRRLADFRGRWLVLFFYPADFTPGCTVEACQFRDLWHEFAAQGAAVIGVSGDSVESHRRFSATHRLPFPVLSDPERSMRRAYGVPHWLGRLSGRVTLVIDGEGIVRSVFNSRKKFRAHALDALAWLKGGHGG